MVERCFDVAEVSGSIPLAPTNNELMCKNVTDKWYEKVIMIFSKEEKEKIINQFAQHKNDTGSIEVQVAILTHKIRTLTEHCKSFPKDFSSKRGLLKMVNKRRACLAYIARKNPEGHVGLIQQLGLRK